MGGGTPGPLGCFILGMCRDDISQQFTVFLSIEQLRIL
jgi:hypothetical protein